ncbi:MAG TPA: aldose 1-epimerase family protein [Acidimicrobiales bacterium]|nr:aldose 1-epimerase family protein [Acidimicrobiales bacterium]
MPPPTGEQFVLVDGDQHAVVTEVGATLRAYGVGTSPVCWGFDEGEIAGGGRGQVLAPWPNRLEDGTYRFGGIEGNAALDEPARRNAIHGLVRWLPWRLEARDDASVRLSWVLHPQPAYPFRMRLAVEYSLGPEGLAVSTTATNEGGGPAPFGLGFHPYLAPGVAGVEGTFLVLPARRRLLLDERGLPAGSEAVAGTAWADLVSLPAGGGGGAVLGRRCLDDCFGDLVTDDDGRWRVRLLPGERAAGEVVLWADAAFGWLMCFTGDTLPGGDRRRGVAVEPMTCPPNALRSGEGLLSLDPGQSFSASWGIAPAGPEGRRAVGDRQAGARRRSARRQGPPRFGSRGSPARPAPHR